MKTAVPRIPAGPLRAGIPAVLLAACGGLIQGFDTGDISNAAPAIGVAGDSLPALTCAPRRYRRFTMRLMVCPRKRVPDYVEAPVTHFVSLIDPDEINTFLQPPLGVSHRLQLVFHDLDDIEMDLPKYSRYDAPKEHHVSALVDFGRSMAPLEDWGLLTHCEAGISRSSAAAITVLVAAGYSPQVAFGMVRRACPHMLPNRRILRIADGMLGTGGRMQAMTEIYRRKAFQRAGYEDPTNVLLAEALARSQSARPNGILEKIRGFFAALRKGPIGTGARMRGVDLHAGAARRRRS